jgi:hypothetical protein
MRSLKPGVIWILVTAVSAPAEPRHKPIPAQAPLRLEEDSAKPAKPDRSPDKTYWKHTFGAAAVGRSALGATISQANNTPSEWGKGAEGFGKRFANSFAKHLLKKGIQYPVAKVFHEELSYQRSDKVGFGPRLKYALLGVVVTHKTTTGERTLSKGELAGAFGSGFLSRLWQPASVRTASAALGSAGLTIGVDAAGNVVREFWPEIRHPHSHERTARVNAKESSALEVTMKR